MKDMVRNIDSLGRIVLPKDIRVQNGLNEGDGLIIKPTPEGLLLIPLRAHCTICGCADAANIIELYHNRVCLCRNCASLLKAKLGEVKQ